MNDLGSELTSFIMSFGILGGLLNNLLIVIEAVIPMLPLSAFVAINVIMYGGVVAFFLSWIFTILGGSLMFWICRNKIKSFIDRKIQENSNYDKAYKLSKHIDNMSIPTLSVLIACPFTPSFIINVGGGLSNMSFLKYIISMIIGKSCMIYFLCYIGDNIVEAINNPMILVRIIILLLIAYIVSMIVNDIVSKKMSRKKDK